MIRFRCALTFAITLVLSLPFADYSEANNSSVQQHRAFPRSSHDNGTVRQLDNPHTTVTVRRVRRSALPSWGNISDPGMRQYQYGYPQGMLLRDFFPSTNIPRVRYMNNSYTAFYEQTYLDSGRNLDKMWDDLTSWFYEMVEEAKTYNYLIRMAIDRIGKYPKWLTLDDLVGSRGSWVLA